MEETLSHDQRSQGGMHYTAVKNIHRVIDPLFLDGLSAELDRIEKDQTLGDRARSHRLRDYQDKLAGLKFLDSMHISHTGIMQFRKMISYIIPGMTISLKKL